MQYGAVHKTKSALSREGGGTKSLGKSDDGKVKQSADMGKGSVKNSKESADILYGRPL